MGPTISRQTQTPVISPVPSSLKLTGNSSLPKLRNIPSSVLIPSSCFIKSFPLLL
uniref:Uncharacterized protein n=1 Tax=Rhizophora mucronata TaxID=61149 RepID=A0A2P2J4V5_RHIMU